MKIGFSGMWLHSGRDSKNSGLSRYAFRILDEFREIGLEHHWDIYHPAAFTPPPNWRVPHFHPHRTATKSLIKRVLWEGFTAARIAKRTAVDVWFSAAQTIPFRATTKRAVMIHDIIPLLFPQYHAKKTVLYYGFAINYAATRAELVLANSESTKRDLVERFQADPKKIIVTPLGPGNNVVVKAQGLPPEVPFKRYILTLGNLEPRRNLQRLYEALRLVRQNPAHADLGLVVVGGKRPGPHDPDGGLKELGLAGAVYFPGYVADEQLPALFGNAELFAYPSLYEGFGMPVLEAMLMGLPIVASNRSAIPEVGGPAAAYFDPENVRQMADEIGKVLDDEHLRRRMSELSLEHAAGFTWQNTAKKTLAALEALVAGEL